MIRNAVSAIGMLLVLTIATPVHAHFQTIIPNIVDVNDTTGRTITLDIRFTHPMAGGPLMNMAAPIRMGVMLKGVQTNLLEQLKAVAVDGKNTYSLSYTLQAPGDHVFFIEPAPYWEEAERTYIVHFSKVVVDGFDGGGGWDKPVGFPVEILPLVRPYGLWTGNTFQGVVMREGKPVPNARVEVEYINDHEPKVKIPNSSFETQVIRANADGEFLYTMPRAGWWGFAALVDGPASMKAPDGKPADLEWGALLWVPVRDMK